jgi:hypothetical protein
VSKEPKERMRQYRERKQIAALRMEESTLEFQDISFVDWLEATNEGYGDWDGVMVSLDLAGLPPFEITDDTGPRSFEGMLESSYPKGHEDYPYIGYERSIGQAESFIDHLLNAAHDAAVVVSRYKRECIQRRIEVLEADVPIDAAARKNVFAEIVRLNRISQTLEKSVKKTFPTWKVKGV